MLRRGDADTSAKGRIAVEPTPSAAATDADADAAGGAEQSGAAIEGRLMGVAVLRSIARMLALRDANRSEIAVSSDSRRLPIRDDPSPPFTAATPPVTPLLFWRRVVLPTAEAAVAVSIDSALLAT